MKMPSFIGSLAVAALVLSFGAVARGQEPNPSARAHGPEAPDSQFPSHVFRLAAHQPRRVQLAFHYGLAQPLLLHGFNAAVDIRYRRLVLTYSHGEGLDVTSFVRGADKAAHIRLEEPWTTGGGIGILLIDELWVLADVKVHHFEASTSIDRASYTNVTVGGEIGWRFFIWKGLNVGLVVRYWPNVYSSAGPGVTLHDKKGNPFVHEPAQQGFGGVFGNVLLGWAFDL